MVVSEGVKVVSTGSSLVVSSVVVVSSTGVASVGVEVSVVSGVVDSSAANSVVEP